MSGISQADRRRRRERFRSDWIPLFAVCQAQLHFAQFPRGRRTLEFQQFDLDEEEVLVKMEIPLINAEGGRSTFLRSYKQSERRENSKALLSSVFFVELSREDEEWKIRSIRLSFSGLAHRTVTANRTEVELRGETWNRSTINRMCQSILEEFSSDRVLLLEHQLELK